MMSILNIDDLLLIGMVDAVAAVREKIAYLFDVVYLGLVNHFLGMVIEQDRSSRRIFLSQSGFIDQILDRVGLMERNPVATPLNQKEKLIPRLQDSAGILNLQPQTDEQCYQKAIGSLGWLGGATRPDISYSVSLLSRFSKDLWETHWQDVTRVFRYIAGTKGLRLCLGNAEGDLVDNFERYVDADFAGDSKFRSTSGYIFCLGIGAVVWHFKKQTITTMSTSDAEFLASAAAIQQLLWFRQLLCRLLMTDILPPTILYNDNVAALALFFDDKYCPHSCHIGVKYYRVRELVEDRCEVDMRYCATGVMVADGLTKCLDCLKQQAIVSMCRLV